MRFARRKLRLQSVGDFLRHFALHRENIFEIAIVSLRPQVRIGPSVNELHIDANLIAGFLNGPLEQGCDTKFVGDRLQVIGFALVLAVEVREMTFKSRTVANFVKISS